MSPVSMSSGEFVAGLVVLAVLAGSVGATAAIVLHARLRHLGGIPAVLAWSTLATTVMLAVHLVPLAVGVLSRWSVMSAAGLALATSLALARRPAAAPEPAARPDAREPDHALEGLAAALSLALATGAILAAAARLVDAPVSELDMLTWNLPQIATWIQEGHFWEIHETVPYWGHDNYPHNGDVLMLGLLLPWENDFLARTLAYPFLLVAGLAVAQLAREVGARRGVALSCAALLLAVPSVTLPALVNAMPDVVLVAMFATGLLFLARHDRSDASADLIVAGLALGIAFGTKWYGVTAVATTLVVWTAARAVRRVSPRRIAREAAAVVGLVALTGGFWLVRNLVLYGNPVYPARIPPLFDAPADVIRDIYGLSLLNYAGDADAWRDHILPAFRMMFAGAGALLSLAAAAGGIGGLRRTRAGATAASTPLWLLSTALLIAVVYAVTPYSALGPEGNPFNVEANTRYAVPALIAATGAAAGLTLLRPAWATAFVVATPAAIVASLMTADFAPAGHIAAATTILLALIAIGTRLRRLRVPVSSTAIVLVAAVALVVVGVGALLVERRFNDQRYGQTDRALATIEAASPESRIALSGAWDDAGPSPVFPAYGPRLRNEVEYLGTFVDGQLRPPKNEREWRRLLLRGDYDFLLMGEADPVIPGPPVRSWAIRARLPIVARTQRFILYDVGGAS